MRRHDYQDLIHVFLGIDIFLKKFLILFIKIFSKYLISFLLYLIFFYLIFNTDKLGYQRITIVMV